MIIACSCCTHRSKDYPKPLCGISHKPEAFFDLWQQDGITVQCPDFKPKPEKPKHVRSKVGQRKIQVSKDSQK